jgi:hypothetical protein
VGTFFVFAGIWLFSFAFCLSALSGCDWGRKFMTTEEGEWNRAAVVAVALVAPIILGTSLFGSASEWLKKRKIEASIEVKVTEVREE